MSAARRCMAGWSRRAHSRRWSERRAARPAWTMIHRARLRESRRLDHGPQHVRAGARRLARRFLEGLVGRGAALSCAGLRADAPCARAGDDAGRHGVPLRHRRHRGGAFARQRGGGGKDIRLGGGVATIRRISFRRADRRAASCRVAGTARQRRKPFRRDRSPETRLCVHASMCRRKTPRIMC